MQTINRQIFKTVIGLHVALVVLLLSWGCVERWFTPKPEIAMPIEFIVDVTPSMPDGGQSEHIPDPVPAPPPEPPPEQLPELVPTPPAPEPPAPEPPDPKPPKPEFERGRRIIRKAESATHHNPLSAEEIQRILAEGATAGTRNSIPDADSRALALIKKTLDTLWQKPSKAASGDAEAFLRVWIALDGSVSRTELSRASGNAVLDQSVERVGQQVRRFHGLSPDFIQRRSPVTIAFTVQ